MLQYRIFVISLINPPSNKCHTTVRKSLIIQILLYGSERFDQITNKIIISSVIDFIIQSNRFDPLRYNYIHLIELLLLFDLLT